MDVLMSLKVFCAVAELKSFTAAAGRLGLSPAMTSKHVLRLESRLRNRLLNRTSRHVSLTEAGLLYFNQIRPLMDGLDEAEATISNIAVSPRGTLKFSGPVWLANSLFIRRLAEYHELYPDVAFDMDLSGRIVNLVDEGFDLALRAMATDRLDPGLVARPLCNVEFCLAASPSYLRRKGKPSRIDELNGHALLAYSRAHNNGVFTIGGLDNRETLKFHVAMQTENETLLHLAALEGMGFVFLPKWMVQSDVEAGRLEIILAPEVKFIITLHAVYPSKKFLSAKVRTFIDFLTSRSLLVGDEDVTQESGSSVSHRAELHAGIDTDAK